MTYKPSGDYREECFCSDCEEEREKMSQANHYVIDSATGITINPGETLTVYKTDGEAVEITVQNPQLATKGPDPAVWGDDWDRPSPPQPTSSFHEDEDECPCCDEPEYCDDEDCKGEYSSPYTGPPGRNPVTGWRCDDGGTSGPYAGLPPSVGPVGVPAQFDIPELSRSDFREMLDACRNGKEFYMELHRSKGDYEYEYEDLIIALTRNFNDLIKAIINNDKREILAEGLGLSNWADIAVYNLAPFELEKIQDWVPTLMKLYKDGEVE